MTFENIFGSVLALFAVTLAALAWLTSLRLKLETESRLSTIVSDSKAITAKLGELQSRVSKLPSTSAANLAAEVAELSDAVARIAKTQQKFAGRFYANEPGSGRPPKAVANGEMDFAELDPEFAAELALQNAPAVSPGKR